MNKRPVPWDYVLINNKIAKEKKKGCIVLDPENFMRKSTMEKLNACNWKYGFMNSFEEAKLITQPNLQFHFNFVSY